MDLASHLVDIIFKTLIVYDDGASRKAVDNVIVKALDQMNLMKSFAATLVQAMEKQLKFNSHIGCLKLLRWSFLLLSNTRFISASKNALGRIIAFQASLLHIALQGSFRIRRACKTSFVHLFSQSPDLYKVYAEDLKNSRIQCKDATDADKKLVALKVTFKSYGGSGTGGQLGEQSKVVCSYLELWLIVLLNNCLSASLALCLNSPRLEA